MQLDELLKRKTAGKFTATIKPPSEGGLPELSIGGRRICDVINVTRNSNEGDANAIYLAHAANVLPELVKALEAWVAQHEAQVLTLGWNSLDEYLSHVKSDSGYVLARAALAQAKAVKQ